METKGNLGIRRTKTKSEVTTHYTEEPNISNLLRSVRGESFFSFAEKNSNIQHRTGGGETKTWNSTELRAKILRSLLSAPLNSTLFFNTENRVDTTGKNVKHRSTFSSSVLPDSERRRRRSLYWLNFYLALSWTSFHLNIRTIL
jgi:hypothetical protein